MSEDQMATSIRAIPGISGVSFGTGMPGGTPLGHAVGSDVLGGSSGKRGLTGVWDMNKPKVEYAELSDTYGKFVVEPLDRGFGVTLGNALRRVLLAAIPGAAVTSVKIENVLHEFSTIQGVVEDVTQIILNLKELSFKLHSDKPKLLRLDVKGKKDVTAGDLQPDAEVEILNPDLHLATLDGKNAHLVMELVVERG